MTGYRTARPVSEDAERKLDDAAATNLVQQAMLNHMGGVTLSGPSLAIPAEALAAAAGVGDAITQLITQLGTIGAQSRSADAFKQALNYFASIKDNPEQILQKTFAGLIELFDALAQLALDLAQAITDLAFNAVTLALGQVKALLNAAWSIPVISELYEKHLGGTLSTMDMFALMVAIPGTVLYKSYSARPPFQTPAR